MIEPFRPQWEFAVLGWLLVGGGVVGLILFFAWCGAQFEQDCRTKGGDHLVNVGRYSAPLCVSKDGRIIE